MGVLYITINIELAKISQWFKLNNLSLNIKKPTTLSRNKNSPTINTNLVLKINDIVIDKVEKTKFLGVIIISSLTWHDHIQILCNKVNKSIWIMLRVKKNVDVNVLKMLCHSLIQPYFQYCNIIWATHHTQHIELLFRNKKSCKNN